MTERAELDLVPMEVDPAKVVNYLLSRSHPLGQSKARFFRALGFRAEAPRELEEALMVHGRENAGVSRVASRFGTKYVVDGPFRSRSGEPVGLRSVWFVESGAAVAKFVTAYPVARRKRCQQDP